MASPQPDQFTRIANELMDAIPTFKFNGTQLRILLVVLRYTYGFQRKSHELSLKFIANNTGVHKQQIKRELDELIKSNVLIQVTAPSFNQTRVIQFNKDYDEWLISRQSAKKLTVSEKADTQSAEMLTPTVSEKADQERNLKEKSKENYREIFDYYLTLGLVRHGKYTKAMDDAIKSAMKNNGYSIDDCKQLLDRHKRTVEATKNSQYPVRPRPLHEFFGQKAYQAKHLICAEYEEGGKYYTNKPATKTYEPTLIT